MSKMTAVQKTKGEPFGQRLARLRKEAGFSQRDLAAETGISYRVIAYYESQSKHPPTHLLPIIAKSLGVTADQLLGMVKTEHIPKTRDSRLQRRLTQLEKLPARERKQIVQFLDKYIEHDKLKKAQ